MKNNKNYKLNQLRKLINNFHKFKSEGKKDDAIDMLHEINFLGSPFGFKLIDKKTVLHSNSRVCALSGEIRDYPIDQLLFRIRKVEDDFDDPVIGDFWAPNPDRVNVGRYNKKNEPKLYAGGNIPTSAAEVSLREIDTYLLIVYKTIELMSYVEVRVKNVLNDDLGQMKTKFFNGVFNDPNEEVHEYCNYFARNFLPDDFDGLTYKSTKLEGGLNFCINKSPNEKLKILGVAKYKGSEFKKLYKVDEDGSLSFSESENEVRKFLEEINSILKNRKVEVPDEIPTELKIVMVKPR